MNAFALCHTREEEEAWHKGRQRCSRGLSRIYEHVVSCPSYLEGLHSAKDSDEQHEDISSFAPVHGHGPGASLTTDNKLERWNPIHRHIGKDFVYNGKRQSHNVMIQMNLK
jgi:hypothetical protein